MLVAKKTTLVGYYQILVRPFVRLPYCGLSDTEFSHFAPATLLLGSSATTILINILLSFGAISRVAIMSGSSYNSAVDESVSIDLPEYNEILVLGCHTE